MNKYKWLNTRWPYTFLRSNQSPRDKLTGWQDATRGQLTARRWWAGPMLLTWYSTVCSLTPEGLACLLPGVALVAEHNVGALAALPCLLQDWAVHGKGMLVALRSQQRLCCETFADVNTVSFTAVLGLLFVFCNNNWPSHRCSCCCPLFHGSCMCSVYSMPYFIVADGYQPQSKYLCGRKDRDANEAQEDKSVFH